jgi:hypothetical protein
MYINKNKAERTVNGLKECFADFVKATIQIQSLHTYYNQGNRNKIAL